VLVQEFLERSAGRFPGRTALVCGDRRLTYAQIEAECNRRAHALAAAGVRRGDRVVVYLDNSVEAVVSVFAILKAGGVFVVVNPTTKADKLAFMLNDCRAAVLVTDARKREAIGAASVATPHLQATLVAGAAAAARTDRLPSRRIDIDLAALIYTSGSTGRPKGVMLTHLNVVSAATSITTYLESSPSDVVLSVLPLSFDYGLYQALMAFKVGATLVLERSFAYPHAVLETLIREKATGFPIVPTIAAVLLQLDLSGYDLSSLRYITNTAAALPTSHIRQLRRLFPHVKLYSMYGLTECKRVSYLPPDQIDVRPGSVGRGMPNEEVYIVDEHGARVGPGVIGQLVVRGSNVMKGYWDRPAETAEVLRPGAFPGERVLYTGDFFKMDEEGYLYFVGRKDDIIKTRGEKVSPREVEEVLCTLDGVAEAAVVGVPDPVLGQAIKAVVTLREGAQISEQDLRRHCAQHLEDFMVPKLVERRHHLPQTSTGKVSKRELSLAMEAGQ
jgi:long-chain acyl-CoA synthetase